MVNIVGVAGSPRRNGNTQTMVEEALGAASHLGAKTTLISLAEKKVNPCIGCNHCRREETLGICALNDDMQGIFPLLIESDGIIIGTPVYLQSLSAQIKAFIDRGRVLRYGKGGSQHNPGLRSEPQFLLTDRVGAVIGVAGGGSQEIAIQQVQIWMFAQNMIVVGDNHGGLGATAVGMVKNDVKGLKEARDLGKKVTEIAELVKNAQRPRSAF